MSPLLLATGALALSPLGAMASAGGAPSGNASAPAPAPAPAATQALPAQVKLGLRAEAARRAVGVTPVLVLVPDERSFVAALALWSGPATPDAQRPRPERFPILIDDGSWRSRERVARFARAFAPEAIVRFSAPADFDWPEPRAAREATMVRAVAGAWGVRAEGKTGADALGELGAGWRAAGFAPVGLSVMHADDAAWVGALALAAGRGLVPVLLSDAERPPSGEAPMSMERLLALDKAVRAAARASGFIFDGAGDDLDAVVLGLSCSTRVTVGPGELAPKGPGPFAMVKPEPLALTDLIGRDLPGAVDRRWAWSGQLVGSSAQGAYNAMSALFLTTSSVAGFDGYEDKGGFAAYAMAPALAAFRDAGLRTRLLSERGRTTAAWRAMVSRGLDSGLVLLTTSGMASFFELQGGGGGGGGKLLPGDVPLLARPAAAHVVHSFSAQNPWNRWTIGGRWIDRGAYVYVGSVHEPFLSAFVPTGALAQRLLAGAPIGASARVDGMPPWRVAVLGDPLVTIGRAGAGAGAGAGGVGGGGGEIARVAEGVGPLVGRLAGGLVLDDELRERLGRKDFDGALRTLQTQGRDRDVARLALAVLGEEGKGEGAVRLSAGAAASAAMGAWRSGDVDVFVRLFERAMGSGARGVLSGAAGAGGADGPGAGGDVGGAGLDEAARADLRDALWQALDPTIVTPTPARARLLAAHVRTDMGETLERDLSDLVTSVRARIGPGEARAVLLEMRDRVSHPGLRAQVDAQLAKTAP